jgi:hypothetical protein
MTTKTLSSLIVAGVLATSAAAAVQLIDPTLVSGSVSSASSVSATPAASDEALFLLRFSATPGNPKQRPAGIVRISR